MDVVDDEVAPDTRSEVLLVEVGVGLVLSACCFQALVFACTGSRDCLTGLEEEQEQGVGVQQLVVDWCSCALELNCCAGRKVAHSLAYKQHCFGRK